MHVEIWSDIVCPWCYVGKRRFEAALEQFAHRDEVTVTWRSFELDPTRRASATSTARRTWPRSTARAASRPSTCRPR
jgi:predicted DsbA family dithiol-disulfide isomerase